jgi:hypothetical protein
MAASDIPVLVKHMALAIYEKEYVKGSKITRIVHSMNIARGRLVEYGFLYPGSEHGPPSNIRLTLKGHKQNNKHIRELASKWTTAKWDKLYKMISEGIEEDEEGSDTLGPSSKKSGKARDSKKKQIRATKIAKKTKKPRIKRAKKAKKA